MCKFFSRKMSFYPKKVHTKAFSNPNFEFTSSKVPYFRISMIATAIANLNQLINVLFTVTKQATMNIPKKITKPMST